MRFIRHIFLLFFFLILTKTSFSQQKYWVFFKDKDNNSLPALSKQCLDNRPTIDETDLPVRDEYVEKLFSEKIIVLQKSRWLNAVSCNLTLEQVQKLSQMSFVKNINLIDVSLKICQNVPIKHSQLAPVMSQIQADEFRKQNLTGKGIKIGVIDAGFYEATQSSSLRHLFSRNAIIDKRDYINAEHLPKFFTAAESFNDSHGTEVLTSISGYDPVEQQGLATNATFYLARTDHGTREWRGEEDNWIAAIEWLDSLGVRLVNTSLGYAKGFSNPAENYKPSEMNGHTSAISKAAQIATEKKGMLLIVSAGNEGDDPNWQIVSTPADTEGVLTVGATNQKTWNRISYSSIGPDFLPYLKPNVACFSLFGTSLSAPVITGFAACLMEAAPELSSKEIRRIIEQSAHLYPYGNNFVGFGVPLASRALALTKNPSQKSIFNKEVICTEATFTLDIGDENIEPATIYHKKNSTLVLSQEVMKVRDGKIIIHRQPYGNQTTIDLKKEVIEVVWK